MSPPALLALILAPAAWAHPPSDCQQVRHTARLARAAALDVASLEVLEDRLCGEGVLPTPPRAPRADCGVFETMWRLAFVLDAEPGLLTEVRAERDASCAGLGAPPGRWSTGQLAVHGDGSIGWPSGILARSADGSWWWHTGAPARAWESWLYPSGAPAVTPDGAFLPDGRPVGGAEGLVRWACAASPDVCAASRQDHDAASGQARTVLAVGMAWYAATH